MFFSVGGGSAVESSCMGILRWTCAFVARMPYLSGRFDVVRPSFLLGVTLFSCLVPSECTATDLIEAAEKEQLLAAADTPSGKLQRSLLNHFSENKHYRATNDGEKKAQFPSRLIEWILRSPEAASLGYEFSISNLSIAGDVSVQDTSIPFSVRIVDSEITGSFLLQRSKIQLLDLRGTTVDYLSLADANIFGDVLLKDGFKSKSAISIAGADIRGDVLCYGSTFGKAPSKGRSFVAEGVHIRGDLWLGDDRGAEPTPTVFNGYVDLTGAYIGRYLKCRDVAFNKYGTASVGTVLINWT